MRSCTVQISVNGQIRDLHLTVFGELNKGNIIAAIGRVMPTAGVDIQAVKYGDLAYIPWDEFR